MSKITLTDLLIKRREKWRKYFENPVYFAKIIKKTVLKQDKKAKNYPFWKCSKRCCKT